MIISKTAFVLKKREEVFKLVDQVENYPGFLSWCDSSEILDKNEIITIAKININFKGLKQNFTTKNVKYYPHKMDIKLIDGPFKKLDGFWEFVKIDDNSCKINFKLEYEYKNFFLEKLISPIFNIIANTLIDNFIKKAEETKYARLNNS